MVRRGIAVAFLCLVCSAVRAEEEPAEWSAPIPVSVTIESDGDHFTRTIRKLTCRAGSFHSRVTVRKVNAAKKYEMGAAIQIVSDTGGQAFYLQTSDLAPPPLSAQIVENSTGSQRTHRLAGQFPLGDPVEIDIGWNGSQLEFSVERQVLGTFRFENPTNMHVVLLATGSRTTFDSNSVSCSLVS